MDFRIGDRVRILSPGNLHGSTGTVWDIKRPATWWERLMGAEPWRWQDHAIAMGVHPKETAYLVDVDGLGRYGISPGPFGFPSYWLAPLTDPKADAFIESVKKWKPEPVVPLPVKERA
jgi:hypothetical protein